MSICGIDFGNLSGLVGHCAKGGVDLILNDSSNRQTATCVSFQGKQRFIGDAAATIAKSNIKNTITCMKLLVGRNYDDPEVQAELARTPLRHTKMPHGGVGFNVDYNDETLTVSAEHIMAIMLTRIKGIVQQANGVNLADGVLAVPSWFTDAQRVGILNACTIAELNCLKVVNEGTAIALSYGIYKSAKGLFHESEPTRVMFVDLGYSSYCVTIAAFVQEKLQILASTCDKFGGRDFDQVIVQYLVEDFKKKTGIDVSSNPKALKKLEVAAEKAKKTLSPAGVTVVDISVECLAEDRDLAARLTRDEFEARSMSLVDRLRAPIEQSLAEAGLTNKDLSDVEVVGGTTRINIIKKTLAEVLELDPSLVNCGLKTTMNADEAVTRGASLQCAMESSRIKVKPFNIIDKVQYPIVVQYEADEEDAKADDNAGGAIAGGMTFIEIYSKGDDLPRKPRRLTFRNKTGSFTVHTAYGENAVLPEGQDRKIAAHFVKIPEQYMSEPHDVRVTFTMDKHGCVVISSTQLMEELPPPPEEEKKEGEEKKEVEEKKEGEEKTEEPAPPKRRFKKVDLEVETTSFGLTKQQIKETIEIEASMANEDRIIIETADRRNELESYVYSMRDKLDGNLRDYATNSEKIQFKENIEKVENWLYEDGFDSTKSLYIKKLDELKAHGNPIERRKWENDHRGENCDGIKKQIDFCKNFATQDTEATAHITAEEKAEVMAKAVELEKWLSDMMDKQAELNLYNDPVLTCELIQGKSKELQSSTRSVINKPKPIPKKEEKKEEEKKEEKQDSSENKEGEEEKSTVDDDNKSTEPVSEEKTEENMDDSASQDKGSDEKDTSDETSGPMEM
jgi:heat shock protein 4